jgi:hypothetical protein
MPRLACVYFEGLAANIVDLALLVLDDFRALGRAYLETDEAEAERERLIRNLLAGQYRKPIRIVAFNTSEGWSRDV